MIMMPINSIDGLNRASLQIMMADQRHCDRVKAEQAMANASPALPYVNVGYIATCEDMTQRGRLPSRLTHAIRSAGL